MLEPLNAKSLYRICTHAELCCEPRHLLDQRRPTRTKPTPRLVMSTVRLVSLHAQSHLCKTARSRNATSLLTVRVRAMTQPASRNAGAQPPAAISSCEIESVQVTSHGGHGMGGKGLVSLANTMALTHVSKRLSLSPTMDGATPMATNMMSRCDADKLSATWRSSQQQQAAAHSSMGFVPHTAPATLAAAATGRSKQQAASSSSSKHRVCSPHGPAAPALHPQPSCVCVCVDPRMLCS